MKDKSLQLDLATLPTKYIALCEFTAQLMDCDAKFVDTQVESFIVNTNFETVLYQEPEDGKLNG